MVSENERKLSDHLIDLAVLASMEGDPEKVKVFKYLARKAMELEACREKPENKGA